MHCSKDCQVWFGQKHQKISSKALVLDPFSEKTLLPRDDNLVNSIVGIDCSWNLAEHAFSERFGGIKRKLPPLLAGNPVNYSKLNKLTTVEAMSASLLILGHDRQGMELLDKFKWGHTFFELNQNLLAEYSKVKSESEVQSIQNDYGLA